MSLLIMDPLSAKKISHFFFFGWGGQFLEGLTKCYLPGFNFTGKFFNTKTYICLAVLGGPISWIARVQFLGGIHELYYHLKSGGFNLRGERKGGPLLGGTLVNSSRKIGSYVLVKKLPRNKASSLTPCLPVDSVLFNQNRLLLALNNTQGH